MNAGVTDDQTQESLPEGVTVGRHTYGHDAGTFCVFMKGASIAVGAFCSIGPEVRILAGSEHITSRATTFPLNALVFDRSGDNSLDAIDRGTTRIGNDVWIGLGAIVLSGISVGDGAVIGAGALVSKSVPPYAVVAGNPAQLLRYRFDADICRRLLGLQWWEWSDEEIAALRPSFMSDVAAFLQEAELSHDARPENGLTRRLREMSPELLTPQAAAPGLRNRARIVGRRHVGSGLDASKHSRTCGLRPCCPAHDSAPRLGYLATMERETAIPRARRTLAARAGHLGVTARARILTSGSSPDLAARL
jgi:acetyltransferase-like isoleucine patch superfamily enzyme